MIGASGPANKNRRLIGTDGNPPFDLYMVSFSFGKGAPIGLNIIVFTQKLEKN